MKNKCIHQLDPKLCTLCKQQREIHNAYQFLYTSKEDNLPDIQSRKQVLRWYKRFAI